MKTRIVIIDASPLLYRSYYGGNKNLRASTGMKTGAMFGFLRSYIALQKRFPQAYFLTVFDGIGVSGRRELYSEYKPLTDKNKAILRQMKHVRMFLEYAGLPTLYDEALEADDFISIASHMWCDRHPLYNTIIVSSDRDFFQLLTHRVMQYDGRKEEFYGPKEVQEILGVPPEHVVWYKCYLGDTADNIPGMPGIGKKKAVELAHLGPFGVTGSLSLDFMRNQRLITLPKSFAGLECLDKRTQKKHNLTVENWFTHMEDGGYNIHEKAQQLLDFYEIKSFTVEDFYHGK